MAELARIAATLMACAFGYGVFTQSSAVAGMIGLAELDLVIRLGMAFVALGLADALAVRLLALPQHHP